MVVIDASVAIKWFLNEEPGLEDARAILNDIKTSPKNYAVPELFYIEMLSVLSRVSKNTSAVKEYLTCLFNLGLLQVRIGAKLLGRAAEIAGEYQLSGYDAIYVATAEELNGIWLSADIKALNRVKGLKIGRALSE